MNRMTRNDKLKFIEEHSHRLMVNVDGSGLAVADVLDSMGIYATRVHLNRGRVTECNIKAAKTIHGG